MPSVDLGLLVMTALLGALMSATSLCTLAGVQQCLRERSWQPLRPIVAASCAAGLVLLSLQFLAPEAAALSLGHRLDLRLVLGALLLGAGALLNGACYLGSVLYLGRGNANFLFTLLGLGIAAAGSAGLAPSAAIASRAAAWLPVAGIAMFALGLGAVLAPLLLRTPGSWPLAQRPEPRRALLAATGVGACAGLVYARHPMWSYGALIDSLAGAGHAMHEALLSAALLFAGATAGALVQHRWQFVPLQALRAVRCLAGGAVMGLGAHLIPGGNDMLLLWSIPGLAIYGLVAYALMVITIAGLLRFGASGVTSRR